MFSGLDSEDCYVGCLSVGVYFKTGDVIGYSSLLETKDCWSGSSYFIETTGGGNVEAFIGSKRASETVSNLVPIVIICKQYLILENVIS